MQINSDNCLSCGQCLETCPHDAIVTHKTHGYARFTISQDKCKNCGSCAEICPNEAIS